MKLTQLTFSRFIAAIAIVIFHFRENVFPFSIESVNNFISYFNVLVSYFFVLSGFILTINSKNVANLNHFYINRFSRIYPLYFFALLLTLILIFSARTPKDTVSFNKVFLSVFLIQSWFREYALTYNFPAWSLSVEAFFYLIFPFTIGSFQKLKIKTLLFLTGLFWVVMQIVFVIMINKGDFFVLSNPLFHLSTFLFGMAAGRIFKNKSDVLIKNIRTIEILSAVSVIVLCFLIISKNLLFNKFYQNGLLAPVFVLLIYTIALSKQRVLRFFTSKRLEYLGEISYGIYILQFPVSILVFGVIDRIKKLSPTASFYIYSIILVGVAALTYEFIEKPCRRMIRNFFYKKATP